MVYPVSIKSKNRKRHKQYSLVNNNLPTFFIPRDVNKNKCEIYLKNKFRKYKRRTLENEDADIIFISKQFGTQLQVRSPFKNNSHLSFADCKHVEDYVSPKNYLFKMGKHRETSLKSNTNNNSTKAVSPRINKKCEEDKKKQTNAFQVMMGSRNKSIGNNSPGKEINIEEIVLEETLKKRQENVKRKLILQNMANAKGALDKQAKEKYREKIIQCKLQKRAYLLKDMLLKTNKKTIPKLTSKSNSSKNCESMEETIPIHDVGNTDSSPINSNNEVQGVYEKDNNTKISINPQTDSSEHKTRDLDKCYGILKPQKKKVDSIKSPKLKTVCKEDVEFLTKLSPSLKKKENMLSYFQKIEKSDISTTIIDDCNDDPDIFDNKIIVKTKIRKRKKKSNLPKNEDNIPLHQLFKKDSNRSDSASMLKCNVDDKPIEKITNKNNLNRKRKYRDKNNENAKMSDVAILSNSKESPIEENKRPRRNVKKPVQFSDSVNFTSSDEEFSKVTSKKRKHLEKKNVNHKELNLKTNKTGKSDIQKDKSTTKLKVKNNTNVDGKRKSSNQQNLTSAAKTKPEKLAPIFKSKTPVDLAALEAKQKFLQSGMPEQLIKVITQKKVQQITAEDLFIPTVHINQNTDVNYPECKSHIFHEDDSIDIPRKYDDTSLVQFLKRKSKDADYDSNELKPIVLTPVESIQKTLDAIKLDYPEFPVYRTYKMLKNKMKGNKLIPVTELNSSNDTTYDIDEDILEDPNSLPWVDKYKALSSKEVIGNFDGMKEIKKWLVTWKENKINTKKQTSKDDSDFSDFCDSDSRDSIRMSDNLVIVTGPTGCGKTSGVYAVAAELSIKVIEVNVSSKRTGKIMLQDLHEATQSHKVNRGTSSKENSQNVFSEIKPKKKRKGRPPILKCTSSQVDDSNPKHTGMSLILIDDADIVFEQDDGFTSAVFQLVQYSKRPVIVVTTSLNCQHLQKFAYCNTIIKMKALTPRMLGTWLDILCLADSGVCQPGTGNNLLEYFNGDMRKCINYLQYFVCSGKSESSVFDTPDSEENCNLVDIQDETSNQSWLDTNICDDNNSQKKHKQTPTSIDFLKPEKKSMLDIFTIWWNMPKQLIPKCINSIESTTRQIENISDLCDIISFGDCIAGDKRDTNSISSHPWQVYETDSVSELETFTEYNRCMENLREISNSLIETSITKSKSDILDNLEFPGMMAKRSHEKSIFGHTMLTESLNLSSVLDRKSMALDYWPTFRTICRSERVKTDSKRNNRFTHYLKSTKMCSSSVFERLSTSLEI